jgi:hypothetical protein
MLLGQQHALGVQISFLSVGFVKPIQLDHVDCCRRMHGAALTRIKPRMNDIRTSVGGKKKQVTGLKLVSPRTLCQHQESCNSVLVDILDQTTVVAI